MEERENKREETASDAELQRLVEDFITQKQVKISDELSAKVLTREDNGKWLVEMIYDGNFYDILHKIGNIPLPPYIERNMTDEQLKSLDYERYQTVFAQKEGSVAAPTAGLHFTEEILEKLKAKGVSIRCSSRADKARQIF